MTYLNTYIQQKSAIKNSKEWVEHLTARGRENTSCYIHSIGANPNLRIQYTTGGTNYWEASYCAGEEFTTALNKEIEKDLQVLCQRAIKTMEKELAESEALAKREYKTLFNENMG